MGIGPESHVKKVYSSSSPIAVNGTPPANGGWSLAADIPSEIYWQSQVASALSSSGSKQALIQGGNFALLRTIPVEDGYVSKLAAAEGK